MSSEAGPITSTVLTVATVIGAGIVIGGFLAGVVGMLLDWDDLGEGRRITRAGYQGGCVALAAVLVELPSA